jgi:putative ATPase
MLDPAGMAHIILIANGDARSTLNALELAVLTTPPNYEGVIRIDLAIAQDSIQRRTIHYDKGADERSAPSSSRCAAPTRTLRSTGWN